LPAEIGLPIPPGPWVKQLDSQEERWEGAGSAVPERIVSTGEVVFSLRPKSLICFQRGERT
jgi:hypothetical protein